MGKPVAMALLVALVAVVGTAGLARPRAVTPSVAREYPATTATEAREDVAGLVAEEQHTELQRLLGDLRNGSNLVRARAARDMAKLGPAAAPAIPDLVEFLCDKNDGWERVRDL